MSALAAVRDGRGGPLFTLAWYAVVLATVFAIAFWVGRAVGPDTAGTERAPDAPHAPMEAH